MFPSAEHWIDLKTQEKPDAWESRSGAKHGVQMGASYFEGPHTPKSQTQGFPGKVAFYHTKNIFVGGGMKSQTKIGRFFGAGPVKKTHAGEQPGLQATCGVNLAIDKLVGVQPEHSRSWFGTSGRIGQSYSGKKPSFKVGLANPLGVISVSLREIPTFIPTLAGHSLLFCTSKQKGKPTIQRSIRLSERGGGNGNQPQRFQLEQ